MPEVTPSKSTKGGNFLNYYLPDKKLPPISPLKRHSTLEQPKKSKSTGRTFLPSNRSYTNDEVEKIRMQVEKPMEIYMQKFHRPHGAALCPKLGLILGRKHVGGHRKKSDSLFSQMKAASSKTSMPAEHRIASCSLIESIIYG